MKVKVNITLEKCPKCSHTYKPRKTRTALQCPKCKHVYSAGDKK